jgi:hypothetical protein
MRERGIRSYKEYKKTLADEEALHSDRRTPEQVAQLAAIMTGIMGNAEESHQWAIKHEKKMARLRKKAHEREQDQFVERLHGIAKETIQLSSKFPLDQQIEILQGLALTYKGNNEELYQMTFNRLNDLQELAK